MKLPEQFLDRMKALLKDEFDDFLKSYEEERYQGIRVNTLKISVEDFLKLSPYKILDRVPWEERGFYIGGKAR